MGWPWARRGEHTADTVGLSLGQSTASSSLEDLSDKEDRLSRKVGLCSLGGSTRRSSYL